MPEKGSEEHTAAARIVSRLGRLPLALEIAAAYFKTWPDISFIGYDARLVNEGLINTIDENPEEFEVISEDQETNTRHKASVRATFLPSWEKLAEFPDAQKLLSCAAFLGPESIRPDLLAKAADLSMDAGSGRPSVYGAALQAAESASLLEKGGDSRVSCHRLVADFIRGSLGEDESITSLLSTSKSLASLVELESSELILALDEVAAEKPHLDAVLGFLDRAKLVQGWADLAFQLAKYHRLRAEYAEAEPLLKRSLEINEKIKGDDHPDVGSILNNLAELLRSQARYDEALPLFERSLEITERTLGPDHPDVGSGLNNLALLIETQGRYDEALPLFERSLEITERALGPGHPDVGTRLNNLAGLLRSQGRHYEALLLYERDLEITERALGPDHPDVGISLSNIAGLLKLQNRYDEALPLYERALEITERALGPGHPDVGSILNNLAGLLESLGRYDEALPLYKRDLEISEKTLGSEHPGVGISLNNLAALLGSQGRNDEALPLYERALEIFEKALGENHPDFLTVLRNYAIFCGEAGNPSRAAELRARLAEIEARGENKSEDQDPDSG